MSQEPARPCTSSRTNQLAPQPGLKYKLKETAMHPEKRSPRKMLLLGLTAATWGLLSLTAGCAPLSTQTGTPFSPSVSPYFGIDTLGPFGVEHERTFDKLPSPPPIDACVYDYQFKLAGAVISTKAPKTLCVGSGIQAGGIPWPPRSKLVTSWRGTSDGELQTREIDLAELGKKWEFRNGHLTVKYRKDRLQLWLEEPDFTKRTSALAGTYQKKPAQLIYEQ